MAVLCMIYTLSWKWFAGFQYKNCVLGHCHAIPWQWFLSPNLKYNCHGMELASIWHSDTNFMISHGNDLCKSQCTSTHVYYDKLMLSIDPTLIPEWEEEMANAEAVWLQHPEAMDYLKAKTVVAQSMTMKPWMTPSMKQMRRCKSLLVELV